MNLADLKAFVAVAETGSIVRAAARLHLTQPAVTRRVQSLEAAMGVALLDRSTKPPTLTEAGRSALAYGRKALQAVDELSWHIRDGRGPGGDFRLGVAPGFAEAGLGDPLDALIRNFPTVAPRITSGWTGALLEAVRDDSLDAALVLLTGAQLDQSEWTLRLFRQDEVVIVSSRNAPVAGSPGIAQVAAHPWVLNPGGCGFRAALQAAADRERVHLDLCAEVQGYELQLSLVARGVGLGLIPSARLRTSPLRKHVKVVAVRGFRLIVTPAVATKTRKTRFAPLVDLMASRLERQRAKPMA